MRNIVISGGTDGIGRALALHHLRAGDRVVVIGRSAEKGAQPGREAAASDRFHFLGADLSLVSENRRIIGEVADRLGHVDALVLCAAYLRMKRFVTSEGFESSFALAYLSRFLLSTGIAPLMRDAEAPVIVNLAVVGAGASAMNWDDLQFTAKHVGTKVWAQTRRANELLAVGFAREHGLGRIKYVMVNPVYVRSSFAGEFAKPVRIVISALGALSAKPAAKAVLPIVDLIEHPPAQELSFYKAATRQDRTPTAADVEDAERLYRETKRILND
ncbi:SDR family NAD(P)-dependent oxidoreductase [Pseudonocardia sp. CA-107938]|uniref:SDR family NAD(P)-dependent oxidoreductase n=1 Tax=Pseudonocardia sp. CA-107938 TaxID=3240021 RepID=UPI003D92A86A